MGSELFDQLLDLVVEVVWFYDGGRGFEVLFEDFKGFEDLSFEQKFGSIDVLHIAVDLLHDDIGDFPVEYRASRKANHLVVSPRKLCGRTDNAIRRKQLVILYRERIPHKGLAMLVAIELSA